MDRKSLEQRYKAIVEPDNIKVMIDLLRYYDTELGINSEETPDNYYIFYIKKLEVMYQHQLSQMNKRAAKVHQIDLEEYIKLIKDERQSAT